MSKKFKKSFKKKRGGDNTSSTERRIRREEIREKTAAAAERRRRMQTYRQPSYQPPSRRNLSHRYLDTYNPNVDYPIRQINPLNHYIQRECIGHDCDLIYPQSRRPIHNRAIWSRQRDYKENALNELRNRLNRATIRNMERNQARMSLNRMMTQGNLNELGPRVINKIINYI